jgi:Cof subfamily protein (haloacid dehalogenase superfamily)
VAEQNQVKAVALDLDGTILRPDGSCSEATHQAIRLVVNTGVTVVLATARPPRDIFGLASATGIDSVSACCLGGVLVDLQSQDLIAMNRMDSQAVYEAICSLKEAVPSVTFGWETGTQAFCEPSYPTSGYPQPEHVPDALDAVVHSVVHLFVRSTALSGDALFHRVRENIPASLHAEWGSESLVDVVSAGVSKLNAIVGLSADMGLDPTEWMAIGDGPADAPLLRWSGHGIAVRNAHADAIEASDEVCGSNLEDGPARVLRHLATAS